MHPNGSKVNTFKEMEEIGRLYLKSLFQDLGNPNIREIMKILSICLAFINEVLEVEVIQGIKFFSKFKVLGIASNRMGA
jgi:hypothetical protein